MQRIISLLKAERDKVARQLSGLNAALAAFAGAYGRGDANKSRSRRKFERERSCEYPSRTESALGKAEGWICWTFQEYSKTLHLGGRPCSHRGSSSREMGEDKGAKEIASQTSQE